MRGNGDIIAEEWTKTNIHERLSMLLNIFAKNLVLLYCADNIRAAHEQLIYDKFMGNLW